MSKLFIPGLSFGCGAFPGVGQPVAAEDTSVSMAVTAERADHFAEQLETPDQTASRHSGWSKPFLYWSSRSRDHSIRPINSANPAHAELHQLQAWVAIWKALDEIVVRDRAELEVAITQG